MPPECRKRGPARYGIDRLCGPNGPERHFEQNLGPEPDRPACEATALTESAPTHFLQHRKIFQQDMRSS
jgi:hypothetical protein